MNVVTFVYEGNGDRADVVISAELGITRSNAAKLIEEGNAKKGDVTLKKNTKLENGAAITVTVPDAVPLDVTAEDIPLEILYEDEDLLVVNKPKGMVVHPAPGILHRIDKNTSGLLMVAKNDASHNFLAEQIKEHSFTRVYHAVVYGTPKKSEGYIEAPIDRHPTKRKQMAIVAGGRDAKTYYKVLSSNNGFSHVELKLFTGRTHQIRVHMSYIGHAVAGDEVYGPKKVITKLGGQCLHAKKLGFIHPKTRKYVEFDSKLPDYFEDFLKANELE